MTNGRSLRDGPALRRSALLVLAIALGSSLQLARAEQWGELLEVLEGSGASDDRLGQSVAVSGDVAVFGVDGADDAAVTGGKALVYRRNGRDWTFETTLIGSSVTTEDRFGFSVATDGQTIVVGAPSGAVGPGSAYVFTWNGSAWVEEARLEGRSFLDPNNPLLFGSGFGRSVAVSGNAVVVGAPFALALVSNEGAAFVFRNEGGSSWNRELSFFGAEGVDFSGEQLGTSVALNGQLLVTGGPNYTNSLFFSDHGAIRLLRRVQGSWVLEDTRVGGPQDRLGESVSIDPTGTRILAGAPADDTTGRVWLYSYNGAWSLDGEIAPGDATEDFGRSVSFGAARIVVGAPLDDSMGTDAGAVYTFNASTLIQEAKLTALAAATDDRFGDSVSISGKVLLTGAPRRNTPSGSDAGTGYVHVCPAAHVDGAHTGVEDGSHAFPFNTVAEGVGSLPNGGYLFVESRSYPETGSLPLTFDTLIYPVPRGGAFTVGQ